MTSGCPPPYTSELAQELAADVLERFARYARIDTQSPATAHRNLPSTPGQWDLLAAAAGRIARARGCADAAIDDHGYVMATVPSTLPAPRATPEPPVVAFFAHVNAFLDLPGAGVQPQVRRRYPDGGATWRCPATRRQVIRPAEGRGLARGQVGRLVTQSDGATLGADDKAGVAAIMGAVAYLLSAHPDEPHGPGCGSASTRTRRSAGGWTFIDLAALRRRRRLHARRLRRRRIQDETFSAATGGDRALPWAQAIHPGWAKDKLVNAAQGSPTDFLASLPTRGLARRRPRDRQGFVHGLAKRQRRERGQHPLHRARLRRRRGWPGTSR